jgi:Sulfotransferase family
MAFTNEQERELNEIVALTRELDQRSHECLGQLERIETTQNRALGREALGRAAAGSLIAFVHIPKTAGKTVITMLATAYRKDAIQDAGNYVRNPERTKKKLTKSSKLEARVLAGHVPYGAFRAHLPVEARYITFLREPVDRVISHYYRHLHRRRPIKVRSPRREQHRLETPGKVRPARHPRADSIEEAMVEMRMPELNNYATRFLCGRESVVGDLPEEALDDAKEALRSFAFVGIQERFDESLVLLQRMLGIGLVPYRPRHVSPNRPDMDELPAEQRALIAEHNELDAELYRFGLGLFEEAVAAAGDGLTVGVEALRASNSAADGNGVEVGRHNPRPGGGAQ